MGGYVKRIAAIKQLKSGFSATGAPLSGLVKAEKYGNFFIAECSLINFAPLTEGKYICAISDGAVTEIFDCPQTERESAINLSAGFAAIICFAKGGAQAIASAVSGGMGYALLSLKAEVERAEDKQKPPSPEENGADAEYHDEAIAEVNYYEFERVENGGDDRPPEEEKARDIAGEKDENDSGAGGERERPFFEKIESEVRRVLEQYPKEPDLCAAVENSDWVKIDYGEGKFYVFGVIYEDGRAQTLCFGVPADGSQPPESLKDVAAFIPAPNGGYFVGCQSAQTGKTIKIKVD